MSDDIEIVRGLLPVLDALRLRGNIDAIRSLHDHAVNEAVRRLFPVASDMITGNGRGPSFIGVLGRPMFEWDGQKTLFNPEARWVCFLGEYRFRTEEEHAIARLIAI